MNHKKVNLKKLDNQKKKRLKIGGIQVFINLFKTKKIKLTSRMIN